MSCSSALGEEWQRAMAQMEQRSSSASQGPRAAGRPGAAGWGEGGGSRYRIVKMRKPSTSDVTRVHAAADTWCKLARHRVAVTRAKHAVVSSAATTRRVHLREGGRGHHWRGDALLLLLAAALSVPHIHRRRCGEPPCIACTATTATGGRGLHAPHARLRA
jgi:hypothetical protein